MPSPIVAHSFYVYASNGHMPTNATYSTNLLIFEIHYHDAKPRCQPFSETEPRAQAFLYKLSVLC